MLGACISPLSLFPLSYGDASNPDNGFNFPGAHSHSAVWTSLPTPIYICHLVATSLCFKRYACLLQMFSVSPNVSRYFQPSGLLNFSLILYNFLVLSTSQTESFPIRLILFPKPPEFLLSIFLEIVHGCRPPSVFAVVNGYLKLLSRSFFQGRTREVRKLALLWFLS